MATTVPKSPPPQYKNTAIPFWRDVRVLGVIGQVIFMALVLIGLGWLIANFIENSRIQGLKLGFEFLNVTAAFDIAEGIQYKATDTFGRALWVGMVNTIRVSFIGIILTTLLALVTGIARLSENWLISKIATIYVETVRNIPLLVQLFFVYFGVILKLPPVKQSIQPFGWPVYLSQRGVALPSLTATSSFPIWLTFVILAIIVAMVLWIIQSRQEEKTGEATNKVTNVVITFLVVVIVGWMITTAFSSNQAIMAASSRKIESFDDFEKVFLAKIDKKELKNLGVAQATLDGLTSSEAVVMLKDNLTARLTELKPAAIPGADAQSESNAAAAESAQGTGEAAGQPQNTEVKALEDQLSLLNKAIITVCAVADSPAEINTASQLRQRSIPVKVNDDKSMTKMADTYNKGDCDLLAGTQAELAAIRPLLKEPDKSDIVPVEAAPLVVNTPALAGFNIQGGLKLTPEFFALLAGLVIYTGAFASEIVRAGILSVSKGQSEAARALGLSESQRLRLIVLPQALRVIIPPMTSQYLNLTKNSSLAVAIGFPDLVAVGNTVLNQSGFPVQVIIIFMVSYLTLSLTISAFLNWYNKKVALVER